MNVKYLLQGVCVLLCLLLSSMSFARPQNVISTCLVKIIIADFITSLGLTPGNGIAIATNTVTGSKTISTTPELALGDLYQGGVVFRLDETKRHGLIVALNQGSNALYSSASPVTATTAQNRLYAQGNGIGAGKNNTTTMTTSQSVSALTSGVSVGPGAMSRNAHATTGADGACDLPVANATGGVAGNVTLSNTSTNCVGGWYLPSVHEMFLLRLAFDVVNTTINAHSGTPLITGVSANYWTSSTINSITNVSGTNYTTPGMSAYYVNFGTTTTTATPTDVWSGGTVSMYRWIRAF